jgi:hypothetical protein
MVHDVAPIPVNALKAQMSQCARAALLLVVLCDFAECASKTSPSIPSAYQAAETLNLACFNALYAACEKFCLAVYTDEHYSGRRKLSFQLAVKEVL